MLLFGLGHTVGGLLANKSYGPNADGVLNAMKSVQFPCSGSICTWYHLYIGFGWFCSVYFFLTAFTMFYVASLPVREQRLFLPLSWALFCSYAVSAILAWLFFFPMPVAFSIASAIFVFIACIGTASAPAPNGCAVE